MSGQSRRRALFLAAWIVTRLVVGLAPLTSEADSSSAEEASPSGRAGEEASRDEGSSTESAPSAQPVHQPPTLALGDWRVTWDDGIRFELRRLVPLPALQWLPSSIEQGHPIVTGRVGVKVQVDGAAYHADESLPDVSAGVELRRGRVFADGEIFFIRPILFKVEFGVTKDSVYLNDFYLGLRDLPVVGTLKGGHLKPPFSLDRLTSGFDTVFMERAAPVDAFAPGYLAGLSVENHYPATRLTGALGWFFDGAGDDTGDASDSLSRIIGRVTWRPYDDASPDAPRVVHLGLSASYLISSNEDIRYRSRPESHLAPYLVDTGDIDASSAGLVGLEAAVVHGPFSLQGEGMLAWVGRHGSDPLTLWGFYLSGSWLLTGESRPYDRQTGVFSSVTPRAPFSIQQRRLGAWEWAVRWSYLDLDDGPVRGGRMSILSTGLNWYLNRHWRVTLDYGFAHVDGPADGDLHVLQSRVQMRF